MTVEQFIEALAQTETADDTFNQYAYDNPHNTIRRANFERYLYQMQNLKPDTMLVMEAPGYRGCRLTGVPVTSRKILLEGIAPFGLFGTSEGYQNPTDPDFERIQGEQSATIVWGVLREIGAVPVIWNTFPFHPHQKNKPLSNRRPRSGETTLGQTFLIQMIGLFAPRRIIAVGNVAHTTLSAMDIACDKVRHPAQGGKNDFVAGMQQLLG